LEGEFAGSPDDTLPCYEFNFGLVVRLDDGTCEHCRKWLTTECENINEFMNGEDWENE